MTGILWTRHDGQGLDRCVVERTATGTRLSGTSLLVVDGAPYEIRYSVITDAAGAMTTVGAHVQGPGNDRRLGLTSDGAGAWTTGGSPILQLFGATDLELGWTPATNMLTILRLGLDIGDSAHVTTAIISFPDPEIERRSQTYERVDETTYRSVSGGDEVVLVVDPAGLVSEHSGGWSMVAVSD